MAQWAVVIPAERLDAERLYHHESLTLPGDGPAPGDQVLVVADEHVVALGRVSVRRRSAGRLLHAAGVRRAGAAST